MIQKIYIGAGHSNADPGAVSGSFKEAELMAELRNLVAQQLTTLGAEVATDGLGMENLSLPQSIELAKTCGPRRIELHLNSGPAAAHGVECLSLPDQKTRAQTIAAAIAGVLQISLRGEHGWKSDTEGQHPRLAFCREADGIVVECFFLSNSEELGKYKLRKAEVASAIARALLNEN